MTVHRSSQVCRLLAVDVIPLCSSPTAFGLQSFGGTLLMLNEGSLCSLAAVRAVGLDFNPVDFPSRDSWSEIVQTKLPFVGCVIKHSADFTEDAELVGTIAGRKIYRLQTELEGTPVGCNLCYEDFYIPEGGKLYIYSSKDQLMLGAYMHVIHPKHGASAIEPISGNTLVLDYKVPVTGEMPSVLVQGVGYSHCPTLIAGVGIEKHISPEDGSGPGLGRYCQISTNCPEGDPYQAQKVSSVAILMADGNALGMCSGSLVNDVAGNFKSYVMTAVHCANATEVSRIPDMASDLWILAFRYEKPHCSSGDYVTL